MAKGPYKTDKGTPERAMAEALRRIGVARKEGATLLDLSGFGLTEVPKELGQLTALTHLYLGNNRLSELPKELGQLTALKELYLFANQLRTVPKELGQLTALTRLDLDNNQLSALPKELGQLTALTHLYLSANQLGAVPKELGQLTALAILYLRNNQLSALPKELGQLTALQELYLSNNQLSAVPKELGQLTSLRFLTLDNNQLSAVPKELGQLAALTQLYLNKNQLSAVPKELGQLTALKILNLSDNQLSAVPKDLARLTALTNLFLDNNQLNVLPNEWEALTRLSPEGRGQGLLAALTHLFLHDNPALGLPPEVLGPTWRECEPLGSKDPAKPAEILAFYFRLQEAAAAETARRLNECKLLLVGQGGVGKTSLVNRLIRGEFNEKEEKTEGIGREPWEIPSPHDGEKITLNVWDFGGQEIMHATHQFFLTKRSIYLVVLDARKGENEGNIHYWLGIIRTFGEDSPVIVVTNKCDPPNDLNLNETRLRLDYPNIKAFVKTSCLSRRGIPELRRLIEQQAQSLEHVFTKLPPGWAEVKQELGAAAAERNYVAESDYRTIAERHGVKEPLQRSLLLRLLHDLGTVLNYNDEEDRYHLNETHILDPEWVTRGVYRLLNEHALFQSHGVLRLRDAKKYLQDMNGYHAEGRDFIIGMMKKFQLCFDHRVDGEPGVLIPELLLKDEPPKLEWEAPGTLAFEYHYDVLPEGVIPRFIVLSHPKHAKGGACWRSGVVLEDEGCRVLVRGDTKAGKVFIHVQPIHTKAVANRRLALKTARNCFDVIHQNLAARAMVPLPDDPKADPIKYEYLCQLEDKYGSDYSWLPDGASREYTVRELLDGIETPEERELKREVSEQLGRIAMSAPGRKRQVVSETPIPAGKPNFVTVSVVGVAVIVVLIGALTMASQYISAWALVPLLIVAVLLGVLVFGFILVVSGAIAGKSYERQVIAVLEKLPLLRNFLPKGRSPTKK